MKYLKFLRYLMPFFWREVLIGALSLASVGLSLTNPYLMKLIIDKAYLGKDFHLFVILILISAVVFIVNGVLTSLSSYLNRMVRLRLSLNLNRLVFQKLQFFPYQFFEDNSTGKNLFNIYYDIDQLTRLLADMIPQTILLIPKSFLIIFIVYKLDPKMAVFSLCLMPIIYIVPFYFGRKLKKTFINLASHSQKIFERLQEIFSHIQLIKTFGKEKTEIKSYLDTLEENLNFGVKSNRVENVGTFANNIVNRFLLGAIVFYGGVQVINGQSTLGNFTAIVAYLSQLSSLQSAFAQFFQQISIGLASCDRLLPILGHKNKKNKETVDFPKTKIIKINFNNFSFSYPNKKPVFENLNFEISGNGFFALVGPSGVGKTTLINLLSRLYQANESILINQKPICEIKNESFYQNLGIVLQEPYLWNDTVFNNILYGKKEASKSEVRQAAKIACADEFINQLPEGYDTKIGENACKISEGQKQRLAIARALIKKPKIIIFDEALSSIDGETENKIIKNLRQNFKNTLTIVVSHRLSTIKKMDAVYFIENEKEILFGKHLELLKISKKYQNYISSQEVAG